MAGRPENNSEQDIRDIAALGTRIAQSDTIVTERVLRSRNQPDTDGSISRQISSGSGDSALSLNGYTTYHVASEAVTERVLFTHGNATGNSLSLIEQPGDRNHRIPVLPTAPITVHVDALRERPISEIHHLATLARRVLAQNPHPTHPR